MCLLDSLVEGATFGVGAAAVAVAVAYAGMKRFFSGYLTEKGKNLATKEDIQGITDKIESVKHDYAKELEKIKVELNRGNFRYEAEFEIVKEICMLLETFYAAVCDLAYEKLNEFDAFYEKTKKIDAVFSSKFISLKAFYDNSIFQKVLKINELIVELRKAYKTDYDKELGKKDYRENQNSTLDFLHYNNEKNLFDMKEYSTNVDLRPNSPVIVQNSIVQEIDHLSLIIKNRMTEWK